MIRIFKTILCFSLLISQSFLNSQTFYVATDGNDANDGSMASPFRTFAKAVSEMGAGDTCIVRGGVYEEELVINRNGNASNYITFKAADGETVEIKATTTVSGWQQHQGSIYKATVNMGVESRFRTVYHNGNYMDLARWPNNEDNNRWTVDCAPVQGGDGSHFLVNNVPNIDWENGGMFYYLATHSGTSWTRPITASSTSRIDHAGVDISRWPFSNHNPTWTEGNTANPHGQLFLFNKLEVLDHAREWYYDDATNTLYFQPSDGNMPTDGSVEYTTRQYAVRLTGDYIKLEGINLFGGGIRIENNADNNQILDCTITHGIEGHDDITNVNAQNNASAIEVYGDNTVIKGCTIDHASLNGIIVLAWAANSPTIEGNTISNCDYIGIHASPIRTSASNTKVLKNTIFNTGRDGMYVAGTNCEIAYNDVSASQIINSDSGVFYTVGNTSAKNNVIHHNWFHDAQAPSYAFNPGDSEKAAGIYLDNDSKGYVVHHNVVWNVSWSGYQVNWNNVGLDFFHNTIYDCGKTMDSWVNGREQENNKIYNNYTNSGPWFTGDGPQEFDIQDNVISTADLLEDPENLDFMPKIESPMIDAGPIIDGFDKPFTGALPDIGAYERAGTAWTAGVNAIEDTGQGNVISVLGSQFTISVTSETCPGEGNGSITISSDLEADYQMTFNGEDYSFLKNTSFSDVAPEEYEICFNVKGSSDKQCFIVTVEAADDITTKTKLNQKELDVEMTSGTAPYHVYVNDVKIFDTNLSSFSVPVSQGDTVKVKSDKECEGELIQSIDFYANIQSYPNPTLGRFQIALPVSEGRIPIEIYDIRAKLISSEIYSVNAGNVDLDLTGRPSGIYFAKLVLDEPLNIKIVKK